MINIMDMTCGDVVKQCETIEEAKEWIDNDDFPNKYDWFKD